MGTADNSDGDVKAGEGRVAGAVDPGSGKGRAVTIKDVAEHAGVTKATVSKYLNRAQGYAIKRETRGRIETAINELDYRPSPLARGLTRAPTSTMGLVVADIVNQFYPQLITGVQAVADESGYTLMLGSSGEDPDRELDLIRAMVHRGVDGLVLVSVRAEAEDILTLRRRGMHIALAGRDLSTLVADTVVGDNQQGAEDATRYLRDLGHRRFAHVAGDPHAKPFLDRCTGFQRATEGLPGEHAVAIARSTSSLEDGRRAAREVLDVAEPPTALFFATDSLALGGLQACADLGLRVPEDVSLMGFDNVVVSSLPGVQLSTVDSEAQKMGQEATELLVKRITKVQQDAAPILRMKRTKIVPRASTAPPRDDLA